MLDGMQGGRREVSDDCRGGPLSSKAEYPRFHVGELIRENDASCRRR